MIDTLPPENAELGDAAIATELTCPVCGGQRFQIRKLIDNLSMVRCSECGLHLSRIDQRKPVAAEFARINAAAYHRAITRLRQQQASELVQYVRQQYAEAADWLDIGCSFGRTLHEARESGFNVFGVEPDAAAFEEARRLLGEGHVHQGLMLDDTRPSSSADVVSTLDVLEHVPVGELPAFARRVHQALRSGGIWVLKVPSTDGLYFKTAHFLNIISSSMSANLIKRLWQTDYEFPHTVYFNKSTLGEFLKRHGFEPIDHFYIEDLPSGTVLDRLLIDNTIPRWQAHVIAPGFSLINRVERLRGRSDALVMVARKQNAG